MKILEVIQRLRYAYFVTKSKNYLYKSEYQKALSTINKVNFGNQLYIQSFKVLLNLALKNQEESLINIHDSFLLFDSNNIYNLDEKRYLKTFLFLSKAQIYKMKNEKEKSIINLKKYNNENTFNIENVRARLIYDFPIVEN
mgnify:CR=1 FL=1